jgi:hypothetical protein
MLGYNRMTGYNKARYNADGTEMSAADTLTMADSTVAKQVLKTLVELIISSDTTAKQQNKSVTETVKLDVWLSVDEQNSDPWSD